MTPITPPETTPKSPRRGHEPNVVSIKWILIGTAAVAIGVVLSFAGAGILVGRMNQQPPPHLPTRQPPQHEPKRVNSWINPGKELAQVKAVWRVHLETYAWIDKSKGIVRIPIERSMAILAGQDKAAAHHSPPGQEHQP